MLWVGILSLYQNSTTINTNGTIVDKKKAKSKYRLTTPKQQWFTHINPTSHMTLENITMNRNNKIQQVSGMSVKKMFQYEKKITWHALLNQHWKCVYEKNTKDRIIMWQKTIKIHPHVSLTKKPLMLFDFI